MSKQRKDKETVNYKKQHKFTRMKFYGKQFLVKEDLQPLQWEMGKETKIIGNYTCFKATVKRPVSELNWWTFSWEDKTY